MEAWKATHLNDYPTQMEKNEELRPSTCELRESSTRIWKEDGRSSAARESFTRSTAKIWNQAPSAIKNAVTMAQAKKLIKEHCKSLPV